MALIALGALVALGCHKAKATAKAAPVPAAPAAATSDEPLWALQTAVQLPPPQPIPPEAIPIEPAAPPEIPAEQPPRAAPKFQPRPTPPPNYTPAVPASNGPAREATPTSPAPQLRPLFTQEQERELRRQVDRNLSAAERSLGRLRQPQSTSADRVRAFILQARQAQKEGDWNRARSLAERAALLAEDLLKSAP